MSKAKYTIQVGDRSLYSSREWKSTKDVKIHTFRVFAPHYSSFNAALTTDRFVHDKAQWLRWSYFTPLGCIVTPGAPAFTNGHIQVSSASPERRPPFQVVLPGEQIQIGKLTCDQFWIKFKFLVLLHHDDEMHRRLLRTSRLIFPLCRPNAQRTRHMYGPLFPQ